MAVGEILKRKKTTAADLPEEVLRLEILTRLPVKSAVRFKCVSKSWLSLFSNPQFAKEHLTRNTTQNPNDYDCLVAESDRKIAILSRYKETFALPSGSIGLVGSVGGLVCLSHDIKLSLWNPAIHQSKEFTLRPNRYRDHLKFKGFGFDRVSDNYKVVVFLCDLRSASVYCSNSDSWIDVSVPDNMFLLRNRGIFLGSSVVKDCPHWTFTTFPRATLTVTSLTAVKFDVRSNDFKLLPEFYFNASVRGENSAYEFVDMNDCPTMVVYDPQSSKCMLDIYSLDGEEGCCVWSKMYSIGPLEFTRQHWSVSQGFYGGEIVFHNEGMFSCYDHKTDTIKSLSTTPSTTDSLVSCFRYSPSLVYLEGMKSVYLTTQTRRTTSLCSRVPRRLINSLKD